MLLCKSFAFLQPHGKEPSTLSRLTKQIELCTAKVLVFHTTKHECDATGSGRKARKSNSQPIPVSVGDILKDAKVASMLGWGAFIDVGNGHRGLLHVDEMKWPEGAMAPSAYDCVKEDQVLEVSMVACHLQHQSWMNSHLMFIV